MSKFKRIRSDIDLQKTKRWTQGGRGWREREENTSKIMKNYYSHFF